MRNSTLLTLAVVFASPLATSAEPTRLDRNNLMLYRASDGKARPVEHALHWQERRAAIVASMQQVMGSLPAKSRRVPLAVKVEEEADAGSYVRRRITYQSEPGSRTPAYLCIPKAALGGGRKTPAVLCLHPTDNKVGHQNVVGLAGKPGRQYAAELAERGYVTLSPSYPHLANYWPNLGKLGYQSGTMKAIWDNMRGLDLLESMREVDSSRGFGVIGHSLGGHNAIFTAVFDARITVLATSCGFDSFVDYRGGGASLWNFGAGWCQMRYMPRLSNYRGRLTEIPFDFPELLGALAPRPVYINAPLHDHNFKAASVDACVAAARPVYHLLGAADKLIVRHPDYAHNFEKADRQGAYGVMDSVLRWSFREQKLATVLERRVLYKQPGRYIGWPSIAQASNGDLLVVFSGDRTGHVSPDGKTQMIRSRDGGRTWSAPVTINDLPIDDRDAGIIRTNKGTLVVSWFTGPPYHTPLQGHYVIRSTDNGKTWGRPIRTAVSTPHGPIQLADGRLLYLGQKPHCSHAKPSDFNGPPAKSPYSVSVEESRDDGQSWRVIGKFPVPEDAQMLSFDEPHMVDVGDGTILTQFRDCWHPLRMWQSRSRDGGRTWSTPKRTRLNGYPPHLIRLGNGWLLSTYAKRWKPFGQFASVSRDAGRTWDVENEVRLSEAFNDDLGYPASVQLQDGTIWTVYYEIDKPGEKPCLMGTHWRLKK